MFSHRSGLPDHAGNLLEDLGFSRTEVISKLAAYPLGPFRDNYEYTNYGLTAGAEAFATATGRPWAALGEQVIFEPLGMTSTSYAYADLLTRQNRVALHRNVDGAFQAGPDADYEPQAPAGSASSSVRDMAKWMTMLLAGGAYDGAAVVDPDQLNAIWSPAFPSRAPTQVGAWAGFYGFGWNVKYEPTGDLQVSHSGAFGRGSATAVTLYPTEELGIVVLTNAPPQGVPEAISAEFVDIVRYGHSTQASWLDFIAPFLEQPATADQTKYSGPVAQAAPSRDLTAYAGVYQNSFYGPLTVSVANGGLALAAGPNAEQHGLTHYSGDEFFFDTTGEDASGLSGAVFTASVSGISSVSVNAWNHEGLGTFAR
jgi:CubicO group peptidase (beta-lactamase class C family)